MEEICEKLQRDRKEGKISEIIVMAEGAGNSSEIANCITQKTGYLVRLTVLGYIQRGGTPTAQSRILASEFGNHAVDLLLKGEKKKMVAVREGRISSVDLDDSLKRTKRLDMSRLKLTEIISH